MDNNPISFVLSMLALGGKLGVKFGRAVAFSLPKERHRPYQWNDGAQTVLKAVPQPKDGITVVSKIVKEPRS